MENIKIAITDDGSPTAYHLTDGAPGEAMHHTGGALSETLYIYGPAIQWAFQKEPRVLSVGLGLGYNEVITAAYAVLTGKSFYLESFESDVILRESFLKFVGNKSNAVYEMVLTGIANALNVNPKPILETLQNAYETKSWVVRPALVMDTAFENKFNGILYDLYSAKTTESLWTEEFLNHFLEKTAGSECAVATYAARGTLKRALRNNGFKIELKPGFLGKRESIFAEKTRGG